MKKSPKKSPSKQKTKLTDFDVTTATDSFFDKRPKSPKREKSNSQSSTKKQATGKEQKSSSPTKDHPEAQAEKDKKQIGNTAEASTA